MSGEGLYTHAAPYKEPVGYFVKPPSADCAHSMRFSPWSGGEEPTDHDIREMIQDINWKLHLISEALRKRAK
jgi:hypothetical protein